jgi:hypothetical protein
VVALRSGWEFFPGPFSFSLSNDKTRASASVTIAEKQAWLLKNSFPRNSQK